MSQAVEELSLVTLKLDGMGRLGEAVARLNSRKVFVLPASLAKRQRLR